MIDGLNLINELREKYGSDLWTEVRLNNLEKEIKKYEDIKSTYEELKSDIDGIVGWSNMLNYYRDLCSKLEKETEVLHILKECPFILEKLFDNYELTEKETDKYFFGTITDEQVAKVKEYFNNETK